MAGNPERRHPKVFIDVHGRTADEVVAIAMRYVEACREREAPWKADGEAAQRHASPDGGTTTT